MIHQSSISKKYSLPKILWLEDDILIVSLLREDFEDKYILDNMRSSDEIKKIKIEDLNIYQAILIDMELASGDKGIEVIKYLKNNDIQAPILVLSNDESISTKIEALGLGVDDYFGKAMAPEEMILRLENAIKRHTRKGSETKINLGSLLIETTRLLVTVQKKELPLSKIEYHLLLSLVKNHPQNLTCEYLQMEIWRQPRVEIGTINTFIWKINKKLSSWDYRLTKDQEKIFLIKKSEYEN